MPLTKEDAFKVADEEYRKLERTRYVSLLFLSIAYFVIAYDLVGVSELSDYSTVLFRNVGIAGVIIASGGLIGLVYSTGRMNRTFPSLEGKALHFLTSSNKALASYVLKNSKRDRTRSVRQLYNLATVIDEWSGGNLSYLQPQTNRVEDFAKAFRNKLIPAVAKATPQQADEYRTWLESVASNILHMAEGNLDAWTSRLQPIDAKASKSQFMAHLKTLGINGGYVAGFLIIGYEVFLFVRAQPGASFDGAIATASALVWGPSLTAYAAFVVQRYLPEKERSQKQNSEKQNT